MRILIVGGGLSGLALANGLLNATTTAPLEVIVFERDTEESITERGGYQIKLAQEGIIGLQECLDAETYAEIKARYGADMAEAPTLIDPTTTDPLVRLSQVKLYAKTKAVSRRVLRAYLLRKVISFKAIQFARRVMGFDIAYTNEGECVKVFFEDGTHEIGDILVAADGSRSRISGQIGLENRTQVNGGFHLTSRGPINDVVTAQLPKVLQDDGTIAFFGRESFGFISIYRTEDPGDITTIADRPHFHDPHLYWAVSFPGHASPKFNTSNPGQSKDAQKSHAKELMRSKGFHPTLVNILDIGSTETIRLTTEMLTSTQPPYNWREIAEGRIGRNGGHRRVFLIGDSIHPMTPGRGMGANQALRDASELLPLLLSLARSSSHAGPEEISRLVEKTNDKYEKVMLPRAFGWVNSSNRTAEMDVTTWEGKALLYLVWVVLSLAGYFATMLEAIGLRESIDPRM